MRNQKVTAPGVKGFDKRKTSVTKPMPNAGKPGQRFDTGSGKAALNKFFKNNAKEMK